MPRLVISRGIFIFICITYYIPIKKDISLVLQLLVMHLMGVHTYCGIIPLVFEILFDDLTVSLS